MTVDPQYLERKQQKDPPCGSTLGPIDQRQPNREEQVTDDLGTNIETLTRPDGRNRRDHADRQQVGLSRGDSPHDGKGRTYDLRAIYPQLREARQP